MTNENKRDAIVEKAPSGGTQDISTRIRNELDRHLVDANDASTFHESREKAGFNKGLREAGNILSRCIGRGDFTIVAAQEVEDAVRAVQNIVHCPTEPYTHNAECWLEYGWIKGENRDHDMLWYNEGNADEFNRWFRALMTKYATDEPSGEMYFKMMIRPDCNFEIICKPKSPELIEEKTK